MSDNSDKTLKRISPVRIILPMVLGIAGIVYLMYSEFDGKAFSLLTFSGYVALFLFFGFVMMAIRDIAYMIRIRVLTGGELGWKKAFNIIMLWEFTSAITPGAIGGTSVAVLYIHKEGIPTGKSAAVVMATSLLDELYFVIMFPLVVLVVGFSDLFSIGGDTGFSFGNRYFLFAIIAYAIKFCWVLLMAYSLFKNPHFFKKIIITVFKLPLLRKWGEKAEKAGNDMVSASGELKMKPFLFWLKAFGATFCSWTARYWVLNFLLIALIYGIPQDLVQSLPDAGTHLLIWARQLVMWIMMVILPTPGGSGLIELIFSDYMADFIPLAGLATVMVILWRLVTYYPYLIMGVFVMPKWVKRVFGKLES
ncbi:MAG: lysylphosphatidylglycerol synthase transmembrane domain-containing protein [Bacteroidota bacterium]